MKHMKQITMKPHGKTTYDELMTLRGFMKVNETFILADVYPYFKTMGVELTNARLNTMIYDLVKNRGAIIRTAKHYRTVGKPQEYKVVNSNLNIIKPPTLLDKFKKKADAKKIVKPEEVETKMLTLADVERIGEMDLAFIGYTIRTEMDIVLRKLKHSEELRTKVSEHYEKTKKELELTKIKMGDDLRKAVKMVESLKVGNADLRTTIGSLNKTVQARNTTIKNMQSELDGLRKRFGETTNEKGFKLGEVAKFTNGRPSHLK
jgi:uncharacterized coiled-coil protein SlyX